MPTEKQTKEIAVKKTPYEFKKLTAKDVFPMVNLIKKIGLDKFSKALTNENIIDALKGGKKDKDSEYIKVGAVIFEIAQVVFEGLGDCEEEVFTLLSKTSNLSVEEIQNLDIDVFLQMIIDFIKKEEFKDFFKVALQFFKKGK